MRILIIGAGDIGLPIINHLSGGGNLLTVIEKDEKNCKQIADQADAAIFRGTGTNIEIWKDAGAEKIDAMLALTNDDDVNTEACEIAKKQFGIPFVISRAHQPENMTRMREGGADVVICPSCETRRLFLNALESRFSEILYEEVDLDFKIVIAIVPRNGSIIGKTMKELELSENCRIGSVLRNNSFEFPTESFMSKGEDRVLLVGMSQFVDKAAEKLVNVELT